MSAGTVDGVCCFQCVRTQQLGIVEDLGQVRYSTIVVVGSMAGRG
jgi:hypothetical protein